MAYLFDPTTGKFTYQPDELPSTTDSILNTAGNIGTVLSKYSAGQATGNLAQAGAQQNQANTANNLYRTELEGAMAGPTNAAKQAAFGDTLANVKPFAFTGSTHMVGNIPVPDATGGLTPANFGPATRSAGQALAARGAATVNSPAFNLPAQPSLAPLPSQSNVPGALGLAGSLAGALAGGKGSGGSFSFGNDSLGGYIKDLFSGHGDSGDPSDPNSSAYNPYADPSNYDQNGNFLGGYDAYGNLMPGDGAYGGGDTSGGDFTNYGGY